MAFDKDRFLDVLASRGDWVDARFIADTFGVTTRTVRNYVKKLNDEGADEIVESSYRGYRLRQDVVREKTRAESAQPEDRADVILRRLISTSQPISIYDLADELCVSDSTIETDLRRVRDSVRLFDLTLARYRDTVSLEGTELSKRKLMSQMLSSESSTGFSAFTGSGMALEGFDVARLSRMVSSLLADHGLTSDDFGLNNVVLHLVIMVQRMRQGMSTPDDGTYDKTWGTPASEAASEICSRLSERFDIDAPTSEVGYLALVIASNSRSEDYSFTSAANLSSLIEEDDVALTQNAVTALEHAYYLDPFDSEFVMRMAVHVHSLLQRMEDGIGSHNPMLGKIKQSYPLIYDMAAFLAQRLSEERGISLSEDEIAFIAFHIGAYLEKNDPESDFVTATFLYMDYHGMYRLALDRIRDEFKSSLSIVRVASVTDFDPTTIETDLVLSPIDIPSPLASQVVILSPIVKDSDLKRIRRAIETQQAKRRGTEAFSLISRFLDPHLFRKIGDYQDKECLIRDLAAECLAQGFSNEGFVDAVLEREALSSTAFGNRVAIPHSMSAQANRSFLSVAVCEKGMSWDTQTVNLVLLLGIAESDRKAFRILFDSLIEVLSESINVTRLIKCRSYSDFVELLNEMIMGRG